MGKIGFLSEKNDSKNIEKNNVAIGLHVLCAKKNKHILFLFQNISQIMKMVSNGGWHYLAVKRLSALLKGITSKRKGDLYFLNCLHSFR